MTSSLIASLVSLPPSQRAKVIRSLTPTEALELLYTWKLWARAEQRTPPGDWQNWLILAGRAWGKTRTGAEWVHEEVWQRGRRRLALVARTAADARDVMVEGNSGLMACAHPSRRPVYEPSKRRVTWPNGAVATTFSAEEPDALRGPQYDAAWCDELAAWQYADETWDMLQFGLRLGTQPRTVITTTPRPTPLVRRLVDASTTALTRGSTFDNSANLAPDFIRNIRERYQGTRLGRQELYAEILTDNPGALFKRDRIDALRVRTHPELVRVVVAVDPAVTANAKSAETGIVAAGLGSDGHGYVLGDYSLSESPAKWGSAVVTAYRQHKADRVIAEVNQGGDLVEATVRTVDPNVSYKAVRATRGKLTRAEPVAALYEQGRVHHVGAFAALEDQQVDWDPTSGADSPDRVDALVWALTELMLGETFSTAAAPPLIPANFESGANF